MIQSELKDGRNDDGQNQWCLIRFKVESKEELIRVPESHAQKAHPWPPNASLHQVTPDASSEDLLPSTCKVVPKGLLSCCFFDVISKNFEDLLSWDSKDQVLHIL